MADRSASLRDAVEARVIAKAARDEAFKQELLRDPKAVLEREAGARLPENLRLTVLEETPDTAYLVLPAHPPSSEGELSDELLESELERVAAGSQWSCSGCW